MNLVQGDSSLAGVADPGVGRTLPFSPRLPQLWQWIAAAGARRRQRQALARLDARLLRDIGLDAGQARAEAAKPFWRV